VDPTAADLCELLDRLARSSERRYGLDGGWTLYEAVRDAGLVGDGQVDLVAYLVGELVTDGRLAFRGRLGGGQPTPPTGAPWASRDLQNHTGYYLTGDGRRDAQTTRQMRRDREVSDALAGQLPSEELAALGPTGVAAVRHNAAEMEAALLDGRWAAAVGAAKDLVESAAHSVLAARGEPADTNTKLMQLVRAAFDAADDRAPGWSLARASVSLAQGLTELRNDEGAGHGRATAPEVGAAEAEFAAVTATALARLLVRRHAEVAVARQ
jgi:hypothetical protein